jgi:hypothetical protein
VLIDAAGRTRRSAMDAAEGESAYRTMQLLKSNPLAEMVYRRVAMSLLDNIIQAAQQAEQAVSLPVEEQPAASEAPKDEAGPARPD